MNNYWKFISVVATLVIGVDVNALIVEVRNQTTMHYEKVDIMATCKACKGAYGRVTTKDIKPRKNKTFHFEDKYLSVPSIIGQLPPNNQLDVDFTIVATPIQVHQVPQETVNVIITYGRDKPIRCLRLPKLTVTLRLDRERAVRLSTRD